MRITQCLIVWTSPGVSTSPPGLSLKQVEEVGGGGGASELLVNVSGVIHELAAREVFTVAENLFQLQLMVLVLVGNSDHLLGLVQSVVLVHRVHVLLSNSVKG